MAQITELIDKLRNLSDFRHNSPNFKQNFLAFIKMLTIFGVSLKNSLNSELSSTSNQTIPYSKIDSLFSGIIIIMGGKESQFPILFPPCCRKSINNSHIDAWNSLVGEFLPEYDYPTIFSHLYQFFLENQNATGSFYTPLWLVEFLLENLKQFLNPEIKNPSIKSSSQQKITEIADLSCGTGNFLLKLGSYYPNAKLIGYDLDPLALELCRLNFLILFQTNSSPFPAEKLPTYHLGLKDSLKHLLPESGFDLLVGNPPWGLDLKPYKNIIDLHYAPLLRKNSEFLKSPQFVDGIKSSKSPKSTYFIRDQLDSFALFLYRHLQVCRPHGIISLILPDTLLFNPVYEPLRKILLERSKILQILYLGEDIFTNVTHPAIILTIQKVKPTKAHQIQIVITALGAEDDSSESPSESLSEIPIKVAEHYSILQKSFTKNLFSNFTIFHKPKEAEIIDKMISTPHFNFGDFVTNSRGVELGKNGEIYQCPYCSLWNPKPHFKFRQGRNSPEKTAKCNHCHELIFASQISDYRKIIHDVTDNSDFDVDSSPISSESQNYPILLGESISRFHFTSNHVIQLGFQGIKYKSHSQYVPPKILFRKTGRGFFAALDYDSHYLVQVIYQFTLKPWNRSESSPKTKISSKKSNQRLL
ncbi:MAG: HsdM family class I SAM-dependent methyltransferase, partial [Promethearchaeota archaeon]